MLKEAARKLFLSTPSARRATVYGSGIGGLYLLFLSTPSARRATGIYDTDVTVETISIHALREEGDCVMAFSRGVMRYFYPRPP